MMARVCAGARSIPMRAIRMLTIVDEFTRECLAIDVARRLNSQDVLYRLGGLFVRAESSSLVKPRPPRSGEVLGGPFPTPDHSATGD